VLPPSCQQANQNVPSVPSNHVPPCLITPNLFPGGVEPGTVGAYTYEQALALYGQSYFLREPRKTFRFTVSTTF
jgi:outer membrane protein insertion porin family